MRKAAIVFGALVGSGGCAGLLGLDAFDQLAEGARCDVAGWTCGPGLTCGPDDVCVPDGAGGGGAGGGGAGGAGGLGGGGAGGNGPTCGNGVVEPGEVCFTEPFVAIPSGGRTSLGLLVLNCSGDGAPDIVVTHRDDNSVGALLNDGSGTYDNLIVSAGPYGPGPLTAADGDPNGGLLTIALNGRLILLPRKAATPCGFDNQILSAATAGVGLDVASADLDGAPGVDSVWLTSEGAANPGERIHHATDVLSVFPSEPPLYLNEVPSAVALANALGSGLPDILVADPDMKSVVVYENTSGTFGFGTYIPANPLGGSPMAIAAADLDGDGLNEIVTANQGSNTVSVLRNLGGGSFASQTPEPTVVGDNGVPAIGPAGLALADIDQDGDIDAVVSNSDDTSGGSSISIFLNDGSGKLLLATSAFPLVASPSPIPVGRQPRAVFLTDLNGDGAADIVLSSTFVDSVTMQSPVFVLLAQP